jgi:hypothetical protein
VNTIHGDRGAQEEIKDVLKERAHFNKDSIAKKQTESIIKDLQLINPKAGDAFTNAIILHDGSIEFSPHPK